MNYFLVSTLRSPSFESLQLERTGCFFVTEDKAIEAARKAAVALPNRTFFVCKPVAELTAPAITPATVNYRELP